MREYDAEELALFRRYRAQRAEARPKACTKAPGCWVEVGPPAMHATVCKVCNGVPRAIDIPPKR